MRHFAAELKADNWQVTYKIAADFITPLQDWIAANKITNLQITNPCDRPFLKLIKSLDLDCEITFLPDNHFLWDKDEFITWANSRKRLLMEDFYREGRKRFNILMDGKKPIGGKWNYDKDNRKPPKKNVRIQVSDIGNKRRGSKITMQGDRYQRLLEKINNRTPLTTTSLNNRQ
ncbi:MAG: cryptochrome/photolyase family protein [Pleurocapsa sp. MO_192.B19]|nr:cryptochrome/photolyase family protein [Pleurocapsa sp. MO_192.B19]